MNLTNPWLGPLQRSYQQIKGKLTQKLLELKHPDGSPLITDVSEGNILVLILSLFSGIAEVIHFYIDNMARETFFATARRYDSLVKHAALVDYHPKLATAALTDVIFTRPLTDTDNPVTIPTGHTVTDSNGNNWEIVKSVTMPANVSQITARYVQHTLVNNGINTTVIQDAITKELRAYLSNPSSGYYEHMSTSKVTVNGTSYTEVETFAYSKPDDKHFIVVSAEDGSTYLLFGDGKYGFKPTVNQRVQGSVYVTQGDNGNIEAASISGNYEDCSYANMNAGGGSNYEDFDTLKRRVPLSTKTLGVAITKQDYIDLALQIGEVGQAALEYVCGRKLNIYVAAVQGEASSALTTKVKEYLELHTPMNTWLNVFAAGISYIVLDVEVFGRPSYKSQDIKEGIISALAAAYPANGPIGGKVRISDIYALIDNVPSVDYLHLKTFYVMPWPKVIFGNAQLKVGQYNQKSAKGTARYLVEFKSGTAFNILPYDNVTTFDAEGKPGYQVFSGSIGNQVSVNYPEGFEFDILFQGSGFQEGYKYEFSVSDANTDYDKSGFNIPVFKLESLTLQINETT